jgi:hypothetical protein
LWLQVPAEPQWCSIFETAFGWTRTKFPFHTSSAKKLNVTNPPIITVVGKAFFDTGHSLKDQSKNGEEIFRVTLHGRFTP